MFDFRTYYKAYNEPVMTEYEETIEVIKRIKENTDCDCCQTEYTKYFNFVAKFILDLYLLEKELNEEYFDEKNSEELKAINYKLYEDILEENYASSYANPKYTVELFGDNIGQILSMLYAKIRDYITYVYQHRIYNMHPLNELFVSFYEHIMSTDDIDIEKLTNYMTTYAKSSLYNFYDNYFLNLVDPNEEYIPEMLGNADFSDVKYLFKYGRYVSDHEVKMAKFINRLPEEKIKLMSDIYTEAYRSGFIRDNKDMSKKSIMTMRYPLGLERVIRLSLDQFRGFSLKPLVSQLYSTEPNKQYSVDHKFDKALYLDQAFAELEINTLKKVIEKYKIYLSQNAGPAVMEIFGETPFSPEVKKESFKYNEEQSKLATNIQRELGTITYTYMPRDEWSFVIVSYPSPEIGDQFEEIFNETIKVNTLDNNVYEPIQQKIIDALDLGDYVHVKGCNGNRTDIKVKLQTLKNPEKETNFHNCIADVNVPLGEVYTTPELKGTHGVLHLKETFLQGVKENFGLKYVNLELKFKDGFIEDYNCTNFESEEESKKYIKENLLEHHDTLPIGEFAIGTNTTAYVMAQKYGIMNILPILIIEKMGPHFAIGDTCFQFSEDLSVYNPLDGKEVVARDNDKSILRKTDMEKAYTFTHTDITLPYSDLEFITIVTKEGQHIDLIRNGRFVLQGTEELNKAFN